MTKKCAPKLIRLPSDVDGLVRWLRQRADPGNVLGMARFGIQPKTVVLGINLTELRGLAKRLGRNHRLAGELWRSGIHEARLLAALIEDPAKVTAAQMDRWARSFDSWDLCDTTCGSLFDRSPFAWKKVREWAGRPEEYVKRAGFALLAWLAVHDRGAVDDAFLACLPLIREAATDERNYVRKAVNWALRQIGKRNVKSCAPALALARELAASEAPTPRWIGRDAFRELNSRCGGKRS